MTSKKLRSWQIETKSLMGKGVSSSHLLSLQKVEYILGWINKVWIRLSWRRLLIKWNQLTCIVALVWHFKYSLVKKKKYIESFSFWHYSLKAETKQQYVESWKRWKLFRGKRKLQGWKKTKLTWKIDDMCEEAVVEV